MTHYTTLGLATDASPEDIKRAYRSAASAAHPDRGGDDAQMAAINKAYAVLSDPERRAAYDATGQDAVPGSLEQEAQAGLVQLFQAALEHGDNLLAEVEQMLGAHMAQLLNHKNQMLAKVARLNKRSGKIRTKGPGENLLQALIDKQIQQLDQQLMQIERGIAVNKRATEMLAAYEQDEPPQQSPIIVDGFGFGAGTAGGSTRWWGR